MTQTAKATVNTNTPTRAKAAVRKPHNTPRAYINVAYKDRDLAKRLGARWDASVKRWYCPADSTLALIYKWRKAPAVAAAGPDVATPANASAANTPTPVMPIRSVREVRRPASKPASRVEATASLFDGNLELPLAS